MISEAFKSFLFHWTSEKLELEEQIKSNKAWNASLRIKNKITSKDEEYLKNKRTLEISENPIVSTITRILPRLITERIGLLQTEYKIVGSVGKGLLSEIPWICIFDKEITTSAQTGYYLVYAFKADMSGFYLCLNQGWTQYEKKFGVKQGLSEIRNNAILANSLLRSDQGFSNRPVELLATKSLGKGYQAGSIYSIYYSFEEVPSDEVLLSDLRNLLGVYRELKGLVGSDILKIKGSLDEEKFQEEVQKGKREDLKPGPVPKKDKKQTSSSYYRPRDVNQSFTALDNASFNCENDPHHHTFLSPITGKQFMEAHHLIPIGKDDDFDVSIDVAENIISLCPNCHRAFHNSTWQHKEKLVSKFHSQRLNGLKLRGIKISLEKLLEYYSNTNDNQ